MDTAKEYADHTGRVLNNYRFHLQSHVVARQEQILDRQKIINFKLDIILLIFFFYALFGIFRKLRNTKNI